jgi:hypothetical protein
MTAYTIDFSSFGQTPTVVGKTSFSLAERTTDTTTTSLALTGKGVYNYGQIQQENFIKLMEHFASNTAPANPTVGQLWFNTVESIMYTCVDSANAAVVASASTKYYPANGKAWMRVGNASAADIITSLGYTPYNSSNPNSYITSAQAPVQSVAGHTGAVTLTSADITNWSTAVAASSAVTSVAGKTGAVALTAADIGGLGSGSSPTFNSLNVTNLITSKTFGVPVVNPTSGQIDGDIKVAGGIIYMWAAGGWKQIFPAQYS